MPTQTLSAVASPVDYDSMSVTDLEHRFERVQMHPQFLNWNEESVRIGDHPMPAYALERLSSMIEIPRNFLHKCSPALSTRILREFIGRVERPMDVLRDRENGYPASFIWQDHISVPTTRVVHAVHDIFPAYALTKQRSGISQSSAFLTDPHAFEVVRGDNINFGLAVQSSLDCSNPTQMVLSFYRPTCTNGAYVTEQSWKLPIRASDGFDSTVLLIQEKAREFEAFREQFGQRLRHAAETTVIDPELHIAALARQLRIPTPVVARVQDAYQEEPNPTVWGIANAFTRAANTAPRFDYADQLWRSMGEVIESSGRCTVCESCPVRDRCSMRHEGD